MKSSSLKMHKNLCNWEQGKETLHKLHRFHGKIRKLTLLPVPTINTYFPQKKANFFVIIKQIFPIYFWILISMNKKTFGKMNKLWKLSKECIFMFFHLRFTMYTYFMQYILNTVESKQMKEYAKDYTYFNSRLFNTIYNKNKQLLLSFFGNENKFQFILFYSFSFKKFSEKWSNFLFFL